MTQRLIVIQWFQNSPYGTFLQGDNIVVYWDDSTNNFYVEKNQTPLSSSSGDIPETFTYNGNSQGYYKQEYTQQSSICSGTSLLTFSRKASFPYLTYSTLQNHPTCSVAPVVCDLDFGSLPSVTNASSDTASDGEITVAATSSNGSIKYRLNFDFAFEDSTGQSSGTFSGLSKGNYLVYARDAVNCQAVIGVTVGVDQAYGVLYRMEFYDNQTLSHHKTEVLQKNYAGDVIEVTGENFVTEYLLRGEGQEDKFVPILVGNMNFSVMSLSDGYFQDVYTNDPEKFRIRHSIDSGSGYNIVWTGKIKPNQFSEAYKSTPYNVNFLATDGLPDLVDIYLLDDVGNRLTGKYKQIELIAWILNKIGLGLNIRSGCNIYASTMDTMADDDPLDQAYVDIERYYLLSSTPNCWDVLSQILEPYGAQIIQYHNVWNIIRVDERVNKFDYREFNSNGIYVSNSSYDPIKFLKNSSQSNRIVWKDQNQTRQILPGYGNLRLIYDMGLKDNLLINGDFSVKNYSYQTNVNGSLETVLGTNPDLRGFQLVNNGATIQTTVDYQDNDNVAIEFQSNQIGAYLLSDSQVLKMGNTDSLKIIVNVKVTQLVAITFGHPQWIKVKIKIIYGSYYVTNKGEWTTVDTSLLFLVNKDDFNQYSSFEFNTENFPDSSYITGQPFHIIAYIPHQVDYDYTSFTDLQNATTTTLFEGAVAEVYISANGRYYYYELRNGDAGTSSPNYFEPADYHPVTNPFKWFLVTFVNYTRLSGGSIKTGFDTIKIQYLNNQKPPPNESIFSQPMENENKLNLDKTIYHGSLNDNGVTFAAPVVYWGPYLTLKTFYSANCADLIYTGYLRNAFGVGYVEWARDGVNESKELEKIYIDMITAQYNKPWNNIEGPFTGDVLFSPIDTMVETMDDNKKYYPISLKINYRNNFYQASFVELTDVTISTGETAASFTTGFSLGFKS